MSTYKNIIGKDVNFLTTDPTTDAAEGQIWYNSTSSVFKDLILNSGWSSGAPLITARGFVAHTGTQTASLLCGGLSSPPASYKTATEEYNGSGWSTGGNLATAIYALASAGTQTAGLVFGGANSSDAKQSTTATYNGTAWSTTPNSMNTARDQLSGGGTQTAALAVGGRTSAAVVTNMEEWNGTSWTNLTAMTQARGYANANGPETAFFIASGATGDNSGTPYTNLTENYDGSSLSSGSNVNTARAAGGAAGDSANAIFYGGDINNSLQVKTEKYDGTSWSEVADMASSKRGSGSGAGTSNNAALSAGNYGAPSTANTEEWNVSTNVITGAAFSSGGNANTARRQLGYTGAGTQNAFMVYGGFAPGGMLNASEEYNGASWTATPNLNTARGQDAGFGTTTAAVCCGGATPTIGKYTEEYNGSSWTTVNSMSTTRYEFGGSGILTAGLALQGDQGPSTPFGVTCEEYDGTNWSSGGSANTARRANSGVGTQTATITAGGQISPGVTANVESYDGSSWSEVNNLNTARSGNAIMGGPAGATTSVITGGSPGPVAITEQWNGTNMVTGVNMANDRSVHGAGGTSISGIVGLGQTGGSPPYGDVFTEEYTGETSALNIKTITTS